MSWSTACSSSRAVAIGAIAVLFAAGAKHVRAEPTDVSTPAPAAAAGATRGHRAARIAVFPPDNVSATAAPMRSLRASVERQLERLGLDVIPPADVERFLADHRIRSTGGIDRERAQAAGTELGATAVLLTAIESWGEDPRPALSVSMRLVSADADAGILWFDGAGRVGDDSPGLLGLGLVTSAAKLDDTILSRLGRSLVAALDGSGPRAPRCDGASRFRPRIPFRKPALRGDRSYSVAVMPFRNLTRRRAGGEVVALEFARQLVASGRFAVLEPGVVREQLLRTRTVMEGGISVDQVRTLLGTLEADLVVAGDIFEYTEQGRTGAPTVHFTATMLDTRTGRIVWQTTSSNAGDDGARWFKLGTVSTAAVLTCRMARTAIDGIVFGAPPAKPRGGDPGAFRRAPEPDASR